MSSRTLIIGIDLNREQPQICYYEKETGSTQAVPMRADGETVSFREILDMPEESTDPEKAPAVPREAAEHAAEMIRRTLSTLGLDTPDTVIAAVMVTAEYLSRPLVAAVREIYAQLGIPAGKGFLQNYRESFFAHTLYQKEELWRRDAGLFRFFGGKISFRSLSLDRKTRPMTAVVKDGPEITLPEDLSLWDEAFCAMIQDSLRQNMYSSIFITGEGFDRAWASRSTAMLCKSGRRVYAADFLFARGACCAARERCGEHRLDEYLYLGDDLVRNNIGMDMRVLGTDTYYPLITAGVNWYDAEKSCELLLDGTDELVFSVSGMQDGQKRQLRMPLPDLPMRPPCTTRLRLQLAFESRGRCVIRAEDLGFGEIFPASGRVWTEVLEEES